MCKCVERDTHTCMPTLLFLGIAQRWHPSTSLRSGREDRVARSLGATRTEEQQAHVRGSIWATRSSVVHRLRLSTKGCTMSLGTSSFRQTPHSPAWWCTLSFVFATRSQRKSNRGCRRPGARLRKLVNRGMDHSTCCSERTCSLLITSWRLTCPRGWRCALLRGDTNRGAASSCSREHLGDAVGVRSPQIAAVHEGLYDQLGNRVGDTHTRT